jgi:hypothetical protein
LRALAVTTATRSDVVPDLPTALRGMVPPIPLAIRLLLRPRHQRPRHRASKSRDEQPLAGPATPAPCDPNEAPYRSSHMKTGQLDFGRFILPGSVRAGIFCRLE